MLIKLHYIHTYIGKLMTSFRFWGIFKVDATCSTLTQHYIHSCYCILRVNLTRLVPFHYHLYWNNYIPFLDISNYLFPVPNEMLVVGELPYPPKNCLSVWHHEGSWCGISLVFFLPIFHTLCMLFTPQKSIGRHYHSVRSIWVWPNESPCVIWGVVTMTLFFGSWLLLQPFGILLWCHSWSFVLHLSWIYIFLLFLV